MKITRDDKTWLYTADFGDRRAVLKSVTTIIDQAFGFYRGFSLDDIQELVQASTAGNKNRAERVVAHAIFMADRFRNAADFGRNVHSMTDLDDDGTLDEETLDPGLRPLLKAWRTFKEETGFVLIESEVKLASRLGYAGTADRIANVDNRAALVEIKSRPFNPVTDVLQTAAYKAAWEEMHPGVRLAKRIVISLNLDGSYSLNENKGPRDFEVFRCALALSNWRQNHGLD